MVHGEGYSIRDMEGVKYRPEGAVTDEADAVGLEWEIVGLGVSIWRGMISSKCFFT